MLRTVSLRQGKKGAQYRVIRGNFCFHAVVYFLRNVLMWGPGPGPGPPFYGTVDVNKLERCDTKDVVVDLMPVPVAL